MNNLENPPSYESIYNQGSLENPFIIDIDEDFQLPPPRRRLFRINAKNFSLTYSNIERQGSSFTKEELFNFLQSLAGVDYVLVGRELHQDGTPHYHALVTFKKKKNLTNERLFDYMESHPNIQSTSNLPAWKTYCKKENDFLESALTSTETNYIELCEGCDSYLQWLNKAANIKLSQQYAKEFWNLIKLPNPYTIDSDDYQGTICPQLTNFTFDNYRFKCLVLIGPSGCGKTTWACINAPKPSLIVSHLDILKRFDPVVHKSIIFDDVSIAHLPRETQIQIVDHDLPRAIHCRHTVALIPAYIPKIFTANVRPMSDDQAINRRIHVYNIIQ